jgi:hypothetical protein
MPEHLLIRLNDFMLGSFRCPKRWRRICRALGNEFLMQFNDYKQPLFIIILVIISWWGALDGLASVVNGSSIKDAAVIYGVARSINGVISLIQSAEIGAIVGSVHPGELLDPINDLIERFSSVMAWSLSSLVLQKILLSIFSSYSFKVIFTIFCVFALFANKIIKSLKVLQKIWITFLIVASLRFSIAIVCVLTAALDYSFLQKIEQASLETVQSFNSEISAGINEVASIEDDIDQELEGLKVAKVRLSDLIEVSQGELEVLKENLGEEPKPSLWGKIRGKEKSPQRLALEQQFDEKKLDIKQFKTELKALETQIECAELRSSGESCEGGWSKLKMMFSPEKISQISQKINQTINDLITLLVSLVLTTILLPLTFLYVFLRLLKMSVSVFAAQNRNFQNEPQNKLVAAENSEK